MDNKDKLKVGLTCYLLATGNETRRHKGKPIEEWIYEYEIIKVGRKYFEVKRKDSSWFNIKFNIDDLSQATDYCQDWKFYFNKEEILNKLESEKIEVKLSEKFRYGRTGLSLDQLKRIYSIVEEK